jgi:hypothetical protein
MPSTLRSDIGGIELLCLCRLHDMFIRECELDRYFIILFNRLIVRGTARKQADVSKDIVDKVVAKIPSLTRVFISSGFDSMTRSQQNSELRIAFSLRACSRWARLSHGVGYLALVLGDNWPKGLMRGSDDEFDGFLGFLVNKRTVLQGGNFSQGL